MPNFVESGGNLGPLLSDGSFESGGRNISGGVAQTQAGGGFNTSQLLGVGGAIGSGIQPQVNSILQQQIAGLRASEARLQKGLLIASAAVDKKFLIQSQVRRRGQIAAGFAKGGVRIGSGSSLNVLVQQARIDQFNQSRFDFNVAVKARNFEIQAQQADHQKKVARIQENIGIATTAFKAGAGAAG